MKHFAKITIILSLILSFLGFLISTYLTIMHFKNIIPPCTIAHGCETVLSSKFATIGVVPIALIGSIYYLTLIFVLELDLTFAKKTKKILILFTFLGLTVSVALVLIQAFILHAFCQWCLTSEAINLILFILILLLNRFE